MQSHTTTTGKDQSVLCPASEAMLAIVLGHACEFVRLLHLPAEQRHFSDDIVQETMLVAHSKIATIAGLEPGAIRAWTRRTMFFVARNTRRAEFRRTATWERLRDVFEHDGIREQIDQANETVTEHFALAFGQLSELDRHLFIGRVWAGLSMPELAERHHLTVRAVTQRMTRARKKFRESFAELDTSDGRADIK